MWDNWPYFQHIISLNYKLPSSTLPQPWAAAACLPIRGMICHQIFTYHTSILCYTNDSIDSEWHIGHWLKYVNNEQAITWQDPCVGRRSGAFVRRFKWQRNAAISLPNFKKKVKCKTWVGWKFPSSGTDMYAWILINYLFVWFCIF